MGIWFSTRRSNFQFDGLISNKVGTRLSQGCKRINEIVNYSVENFIKLPKCGNLMKITISGNLWKVLVKICKLLILICKILIWWGFEFQHRDLISSCWGLISKVGICFHPIQKAENGENSIKKISQRNRKEAQYRKWKETKYYFIYVHKYSH